jgi:hypothetical protein
LDQKVLAEMAHRQYKEEPGVAVVGDHVSVQLSFSCIVSSGNDMLYFAHGSQ